MEIVHKKGHILMLHAKMEEVSRIKEPLYGYEQEIILIPTSKLKVIEVQRKASGSHVKRLSESIKRIGFVIPLVVVKRGDENIVIDGQHRFLAAKELGIKKLPAIVIPEKYAHNLMELNIEKQMALRDKAYVSLNIYTMYLNEDASMDEEDGRIMDSIEYAYYVTLGMAYKEKPRLFGSAYESILRKVDTFLPKPLEKAIVERRERAKIVMEADGLVREAAKKVRELGIEHPFLYKEIVSFCTPIKRKKKVKETFAETFEGLKKNLVNLATNPTRLREHRFTSASS